MLTTPPIFILGCMRSGTTILHRLLLNYIPSAVDIDDLDFEGRVFWQQHGIAMGSPKTGTRCDCHHGRQLAPEMAQTIRNYFAQRAGSTGHIITKNPHLNNKLGLIHTLFPQAKIIHLIRTNLAVVASTKRRFEEAYGGRNYLQVPVKHYWPNVELPCWWCVPETLERSPNFREQAGVPSPQHDDYKHFFRLHAEMDRYFPGDGFKRIPESWLHINANLLRQVTTLNLHHNYLLVRYEALVFNTPATLAQIADFCQINQTKHDHIPHQLATASLEKWREMLTDREKKICAQTVQDFSAEAHLISKEIAADLII
jgi:hypothetical protein